MKMTKAQLTAHIFALKKANELMDEQWGSATNEAGFKMSEHRFMKKLMDTDYICPFSPPFNGGAKPFLAEMYKEMNLGLIEDLEYKLDRLNEQSSS